MSQTPIQSYARTKVTLRYIPPQLSCPQRPTSIWIGLIPLHRSCRSFPYLFTQTNDILLIFTIIKLRPTGNILYTGGAHELRRNLRPVIINDVVLWVPEKTHKESREDNLIGDVSSCPSRCHYHRSDSCVTGEGHCTHDK